MADLQYRNTTIEIPSLARYKQLLKYEQLFHNMVRNLRCAVCLTLPRLHNPIYNCQFQHNLCYVCFQQLTAPIECPTCRDESIGHVDDRLTRESIFELVQCQPYECVHEGCGQSFSASEIEHHEYSCRYYASKCLSKGCAFTFVYDNIESYLLHPHFNVASTHYPKNQGWLITVDIDSVYQHATDEMILSNGHAGPNTLLTVPEPEDVLPVPPAKKHKLALVFEEQGDHTLAMYVGIRVLENHYMSNTAFQDTFALEVFQNFGFGRLNHRYETVHPHYQNQPDNIRKAARFLTLNIMQLCEMRNASLIHQCSVCLQNRPHFHMLVKHLEEY